MVDKAPVAITIDDLMRLDAENPDQWYEVVNGELVEVMAANWLHNLTIGNLFTLFNPYVTTHQLGTVHGDGLTYILKMKDGKVKTSRIPDFSFLPSEQLPPEDDAEQPIIGAPALAVEIISPSQKTSDLLKRMPDYFDAGTEEFWVLYPADKELHRYRNNHRPHIYHMGDSFIAETLFPDLEIIIATIFAHPNR